jgi:hypothetical protein
VVAPEGQHPPLSEPVERTLHPGRRRGLPHDTHDAHDTRHTTHTTHDERQAGQKMKAIRAGRAERGIHACGGEGDTYGIGE